MGNILIEKNEELTSEDKAKFAYFGENAKIRPPFRILNPQNIYIGDRVSIREFAYIHAYLDISENRKYIDPKYINDFTDEQYQFQSSIRIEQETQIQRNLFISCTNSIIIGRNCTFSERIFIGDNNHNSFHPHVPIMQQSLQRGIPINIGQGSWVGVGAVILKGTILGMNSTVGANSVVQGQYPDYAVVGQEKAKLLFVRHGGKESS